MLDRQMNKLKLISLIILTTTLSGCVWRSGFFIVNRTNNKIIITYSLTSKSEHDLALRDTVQFFKLDTSEDMDDDDIIGEPFVQEYSKIFIDGGTRFTVTINPNTAMTGGYNLYGFTYHPSDKRRKEMFDNVINMQVIRMDTKDTVNLKPSLLSDFIKSFGRHHTGLIFD